ncbi:glycoside hydrolase family 43 protein [Bacteroidales bacterium OttesenSCG-928-L03]|nr:glycoside hydrolase family 43 protein [Bacteroidales bacterium OttesenSCG-928-L03]
MRRVLYLFVLVALVTSCKPNKPVEEKTAEPVYLFTSFHEPADEGLRFLYSYDGYHWDSIPGIWLQPQVGNQQVMRDPSIVRGPEGTFHLVWTSSWKGDKGFGYASSKDLINWTEQGLIEVMDDSTTVNVWAPELFYDDETEDYYVVWSSTIPFKFDKGIEDEYNNHRLYYTKTKDFKNFTKAEVLYDPGYSSIDAVIVKRAPKDYVLVLKDNTRPERNMKVAFAESATGPYGDLSTEPFTENFTEGPSVVKVGEDWLIYFDAYQKKSYDAVSTRDFKTFTEINDRISIPEGHKHGTIFMADKDILTGLLNHQP